MGKHLVDEDTFIRDLTVRKQGSIHRARAKYKSSKIFCERDARDHIL